MTKGSSNKENVPIMNRCVIYTYYIIINISEDKNSEQFNNYKKFLNILINLFFNLYPRICLLILVREEVWGEKH